MTYVSFIPIFVQIIVAKNFPVFVAYFIVTSTVTLNAFITPINNLYKPTTLNFGFMWNCVCSKPSFHLLKTLCNFGSTCEMTSVKRTRLLFKPLQI